ncbi:MAG: pentapeptide repeat-containing protein [Synechococcaceae cyanobacterium RL_1_2]|nr:pentapeptide repeat-containing protein [Synechococcaceae cyanobacterium RL_1_2]
MAQSPLDDRPSQPNSQEEALNHVPSSAKTSGVNEFLGDMVPKNFPPASYFYEKEQDDLTPGLTFTAIVITLIGLLTGNGWLGLTGTMVTLFLSLKVIFPAIKSWFDKFLTNEERVTFVAVLGILIAIVGLLKYTGIYHLVDVWLTQFKYDEFGSWAEWVGALGQILIALLAVYVAWQQYVISRELTIQQNRITQQQTIDTYFQGISELALNEEGLLEDWPQERSIAEGRTAALLSSVDSAGKSKILRFLSQSRLITPLMRDRHLGRAILDGSGGYAEDRRYGIRVINLGVMLAGTDLSKQDLRWTDLSEANMVRADLSHCDLVKANLSRTVLYESNLAGADIKGMKLFYGQLDHASPRSRTHAPDYDTGAYTGAVVENVNFKGVKRMDEQQRYYCCSWCGEQSRKTIPGGCEGIPNRLGR